MAGMEGLGKLVNVVPIASGAGLSMKGASACLFVCTGADTFTVTVSATFGGSYATPGNILTHFYQSTNTGGTAAWTKQTQAASNAIVQGSAYVTAFEVLTSMLPDPKAYVKVTASAAGLVMAVFHDLTVQRGPANLAIVSA